MKDLFEGNLFTSPLLLNSGDEKFETLFTTDKILIERIISSSDFTPNGEWYDQERDEWVVLLKGMAVLEFEDKTQKELHPGDYLLLKSHVRHRLLMTSLSENTLWLAVHGKL